MKRFAFSLISALILGSGTLVVNAADKVTLTGVLSDELCVSKHVMQHTSAADCTRECIKHGADYVLVVKDKTYTLKPDNTVAQDDLDRFAGLNVTVNGEPESDFVWVLSVMPAK
jgi:hypothetical protein